MALGMVFNVAMDILMVAVVRASWPAGIHVHAHLSRTWFQFHCRLEFTAGRTFQNFYATEYERQNQRRRYGENVKDFYESVYSQDHPSDEPHGWIQWKGTDVCIDLHCKCGNRFHFDGDFLYFYQCSCCGEKYALGQNVKLIPLNDEQAEYVEKEHVGFKTNKIEDEKNFRFVSAIESYPRTATWTAFRGNIKMLSFNPGDHQKWDFDEKVEVICLHFSAKEPTTAEFIVYTDNKESQTISVDIPVAYQHVMIEISRECKSIMLARIDYVVNKTPVFVVYVDGKVRED